MQDKYTGDAGDFGKLSLLRELAKGERLGVCWYFTTGHGETNTHGMHTTFLTKGKQYRHLDEGVFDGLGKLIGEASRKPEVRCVASLERSGLLPADTIYHRVPVPANGKARKDWADAMNAAMREAVFTFTDPDNGIAARPTIRHSTPGELLSLSARGPVLAYHHQGRMAGGASAEFTALRAMLLANGFKRVCACRLSPGTSRFYFLLNGAEVHEFRMRSFCDRWAKYAEWFGGQ
jgi:hypothetical protein